MIKYDLNEEDLPLHIFLRSDDSGNCVRVWMKRDGETQVVCRFTDRGTLVLPVLNSAVAKRMGLPLGLNNVISIVLEND